MPGQISRHHKERIRNGGFDVERCGKYKCGHERRNYRLQPVITALVTTFVFSTTLNVKTPIPYPLFMMAAYLPWHLFSNSLTRSSTSLVANANLLTKVYFPRIIIPVASVLASLVD